MGRSLRQASLRRAPMNAASSHHPHNKGRTGKKGKTSNESPSNFQARLSHRCHGAWRHFRARCAGSRRAVGGDGLDHANLWRTVMRAIEAKTFSGYDGLRQVELPKPQPAKDRVLVRVTAAGVTPLEYTVLSGGHPRAKAPLVLGNEGAGLIEDAGDSRLAVGSRVMFTGPYGVGENGTWQEWLLVRPEHLALAPDAIDDV